VTWLNVRKCPLSRVYAFPPVPVVSPGFPPVCGVLVGLRSRFDAGRPPLVPQPSQHRAVTVGAEALVAIPGRSLMPIPGWAPMDRFPVGER
jgi:hypothetical protein